MAVIVVSLVSFFLGTNHVSAPPPHARVEADPFIPEPFWVVFAVFFPAVTGIMAGVNMSGDLKNPRRSIPRGTLAAIAVSYVIYMIIPLELNSRADTESLVTDPLIMRTLALWGPAILLGVWGATLSSALGSILGAPRILQALARDGILPRPMRIFGRGSGVNDEPRFGTYFSLALALGVVAVGDLNAVAPVLTMFFLASYAVVNFVSASERFLRNPAFRPTFRVHWSLSFAGALGCVAVMFLINPVATIVAMAVVTVIWGLLNRRRARAQWGDIRQGLWINLIRWAAAHIRPSTHAKSWRPNILVLAGSPTKRWYLIDLANTLSHDRGLLTIATILPEPAPSQRKRHLAETVREHLAERKVDALVRVVSAPTPYVGASVLVEAYGLGGLVPNTVLLGDGETTSDADEYATMIHHFHDAGRNVVVVRAADDTTFGDRRRIDVWLRSMRDNGALMIMLANTLARFEVMARSDDHRADGGAQGGCRRRGDDEPAGGVRTGPAHGRRRRDRRPAPGRGGDHRSLGHGRPLPDRLAGPVRPPGRFPRTPRIAARRCGHDDARGIRARVQRRRHRSDPGLTTGCGPTIAYTIEAIRGRRRAAGPGPGGRRRKALATAPEARHDGWRSMM